MSNSVKETQNKGYYGVFFTEIGRFAFWDPLWGTWGNVRRSS